MARMEELSIDPLRESIDHDGPNQQRHREIEVLSQEPGALRWRWDFLDVDVSHANPWLSSEIVGFSRSGNSSPAGPRTQANSGSATVASCGMKGCFVMFAFAHYPPKR